MIIWWDWHTYIILVFCVSCLNYLESLLDLFQYTATPHTPGRPTLVIIFIHLFTFSILVISSLTSPGSCYQDPIILVFTVHNFSKCVTKTFSLVTGDDVIHDYSILEILPSSIHELPEFSLCDTIYVPHDICFQDFIFHDLRRVIFTPNILYINILVLYHLLQKMMTDINIFCTNT